MRFCSCAQRAKADTNSSQYLAASLVTWSWIRFSSGNVFRLGMRSSLFSDSLRASLSDMSGRAREA
eukprot:CAMPEP_0206227082 /NCGR_PEP_ID=MMETSP0047_2-20121206/8435_1 /ASSEMBLY_ACC=CAM_ASM_000192 /TAXON_ID=195065 /ORGANISM="Chroomonas mesostigmatica_cf, Strain CCMP1168" /LENGTH=65 /DNA_ID=CAMNT_0053650213 /DNA_START=370 /DNA_END=567 /DNA_ORIENTATION=+